MAQPVTPFAHEDTELKKAIDDCRASVPGQKRKTEKGGEPRLLWSTVAAWIRDNDPDRYDFGQSVFSKWSRGHSHANEEMLAGLKASRDHHDQRAGRLAARSAPAPASATIAPTAVVAPGARAGRVAVRSLRITRGVVLAHLT